VLSRIPKPSDRGGRGWPSIRLGQEARPTRPVPETGLLLGVVVATVLLLVLSSSVSDVSAASSLTYGSVAVVSPSVPAVTNETNFSFANSTPNFNGEFAGTTGGFSVTITASPDYAIGHLKTTFTSKVTGGKAPFTYAWQFGDGNTSTLANPTHTYEELGTFLVILNVTDSTHQMVSTLTFVTSAQVEQGTLSVGKGLGKVSPMFWGYNLDFQTGPSGYANSTIAGYVNETPIVYLRLPVTNVGYPDSPEWKDITEFCAWTRCEEIATVGGPIPTPAQAVAAMVRATKIGIDPAYWAFGNEPDLWGVEGKPTSGLQYADLVHEWITLARPLFPHAKFLGAEITGNPRFGTSYIYNVTKVDGHLIQGIGIQLYPQFGYGTVSGFLRSLTVGNSIEVGIPRVRALMAQACPTCSIPILLSEFQGGSGENYKYTPFREGFPDATFFAASIVQAFNAHLVQFMPWTLAGAANGLTTHPSNCDMGLIQLNASCDGTVLGPVYYLYKNLLHQFPYGKLSNVTVSRVADVYAVEVKNGSDTVALIVNANPEYTADLAIGSGFPTSGTLTTLLMDLAHVSVPYKAVVELSSGNVTHVTLPPLGVMLLNFTHATGPGPGWPGPSTSNPQPPSPSASPPVATANASALHAPGPSAVHSTIAPVEGSTAPSVPEVTSLPIPAASDQSGSPPVAARWSSAS